MYQFVIIVHVLVSIAIISLVLLQHGKGADAGATLGAGASQSVFGSQGAGSILVRITTLMAVVFFVTSISLGYMASQQVKQAKQRSIPTQKVDLPASIDKKSNLPDIPGI